MMDAPSPKLLTLLKRHNIALMDWTNAYPPSEREPKKAIYEQELANLSAYLVELEARSAALAPVHVDAAPEPPAPKLAIGDIVYWNGALHYVIEREFSQLYEGGGYWIYGLSLNENGKWHTVVSEDKLIPEQGKTRHFTPEQAALLSVARKAGNNGQ